MPGRLQRAAFRIVVFCLVLLPAFCAAGELIVSAAASLINALSEIGQAFEAAHPGDRVIFNFGASGSLLQQIGRGAPVDVFASADEETMDRAQAQGLLLPGTRTDFVRNRLVLITPSDSGLALSSLKDLAGSAVRRLAVAQPASVPVGRYSKAALDAENLWEPLAQKYIFTQNVRQSLDYVSRGEVDAGFVYATDAAIMPHKVKVAFEIRLQTPILYPIAVVKDSRNSGLAREFTAYVLSDTGQQVLAKYGFAKP